MEFRLGVEPKIRVRTKLRYTQYACIHSLATTVKDKTHDKKIIYSKENQRDSGFLL